MAGFDAGTAVEPLAYDFTTVKGEDGKPCKGKGVIPEPSQPEVEKFIDDVAGAVKAAGAEVDLNESPDEIARQVADVGASEFAKARGAIFDKLVAFGKGKPTREQLEALPFRVQQAFIDWLLDELTDPTRSNGATGH